MSSAKAEVTLRLLLDGNQRFVAGAPLYARDISSARAAAAEQRPVAAVFTCIDSRVTAESLFDCDFGQLIVVRTAGHVLDQASQGSLEFAVNQLGVPLVVVLGHERCGALRAAVDARRDQVDQPGFLAEQLGDCAAMALESGQQDPYSSAMRYHVTATADFLRKHPALTDARIVGAHYSLDHGTVHVAE